MKSWLILAILVLAFCSLPAMGGIIFSEDFSGDSGGLAKTSLTNWNVLSGSNVDVGAFGGLCGPSPAQCIDTQGTGGNSDADIQTKSTFAVGPGFTYDFAFTLTNGGGSNSFLLTIGSFSTLISTPAYSDGAHDVSFTLASNPNATIRITDQGPADSVGIYVGQIVFSSTANTSVPEPATIGIVGVTLIGLAAFRLRQRQRA